MVGAIRRLAVATGMVALLTLSMSAAALNTNYLLPGGDVKINRGVLKGENKFCALTFDDGPDTKYTLQIAEILSRYGIKATFFVVGYRVERYPDQVVTLAASGHEIANHSYNHPDFTKLSSAEQQRQLNRTNDALSKLGIKPRWFRPPYGACNKATVSSSRKCGLSPVLWSVDPRDWSSPGSGKICNRVLNDSGNGAVILLHSTNAQTVEALPGIIEGLKKRGYEFLTMTQWAAAASGSKVPPAVPLKLPASPAAEPLQPPAVRPPLGDFPEPVLRGDSLEGGLAPIEVQPDFYVPLELPQGPADIRDSAGLAQSSIAHTRPDREDVLPQPITLPTPAERFSVYSNFGQPGEIRSVLSEHEGRKLRRAQP